MNDADREIVLHKRIRDLEAGRKLACDAWVVSNDRANAMESERDTARAEADALRASLTEARAIITRIAVVCATIDCEDLVADHTTPDDYNDLVEHVERVVEDGHVQRSAAAKARPVILALVEAAETWKWGAAQHGTPLPQGLDALLSVLNVAESYDDHTAGEIADVLRAMVGVDHG